MVNVDYRLRESLWRFLRQVVTDTALDCPVLILAREFSGIGAGVRMWRAIDITLEGDGGYADYRRLSQPRFEIVIGRLALSQSEAPAIVVDDNRNVIRVIE